MKAITLLLSTFVFFQCGGPSKEASSVDSAAVAAPANAATETVSEEAAPLKQVDMDEFIKDPFLISSTYEDAVESLKNDGITFKDTLIFDRHILTFANSRIEIIMADDNQDELTDMICRADITTDQIYFRDPVSIGMGLDDFLGQTYLSRDSLVLDKASGMKYYEHRLPFGEDGSWRMVIWFKADTLRRFQYEIYPCEFTYDY